MLISWICWPKHMVGSWRSLPTLSTLLINCFIPQELILIWETTVARNLTSISLDRTLASRSTLSAVSTVASSLLPSLLSNGEASTPVYGTAFLSWRLLALLGTLNRLLTLSRLLPSPATATRTAWHTLDPIPIKDASWPSVTACCANWGPAFVAELIPLPLSPITLLKHHVPPEIIPFFLLLT